MEIRNYFLVRSIIFYLLSFKANIDPIVVEYFKIILSEGQDNIFRYGVITFNFNFNMHHKLLAFSE